MLRPLLLLLSMSALISCSTGSGTAANKAESAAAELDLTDSAWQLHSVGDLMVDPGSENLSWIRIQNAENAWNIDGNTGCNSLRGSAELAGSKLSFGPIATTKRYCPQVAAIEAAMLAALKKAQQWTIKSAQLELLDADGARLMVFTSKSAPAE